MLHAHPNNVVQNLLVHFTHYKFPFKGNLSQIWSIFLGKENLSLFIMKNHQTTNSHGESSKIFEREQDNKKTKINHGSCPFGVGRLSFVQRKRKTTKEYLPFIKSYTIFYCPFSYLFEVKPQGVREELHKSFEYFKSYFSLWLVMVETMEDFA